MVPYDTRPSGRVAQLARRWPGRLAPGVLAVVLLACLPFALLGAGREQESFHRLSVSGSPFECGLAHGKAFGKQIHGLLGTAARMRLRSRRSLRRMAHAFDPFVGSDHRREMRGIARGSGLRYEDILVLNCWYEIEMERFACRQVVALGSATQSGNLIHGRNLDWPDYEGRLSKSLVLLDCAPTGKRRMTLLVWPGMIGSLTGTNDKGITIAMNQLGLSLAVGEPVFLMMRRVLEESGTLPEALDVLKAAPVTADCAIVVSDAEGDDAVCVEWYAGEAHTRGPAEGLLVADNSPHAEQWWTRQTDTALWKLARRHAGRITPESVRAVLGDPRVLLPMNLYSCVFVPAAAELHLAVGESPAASACSYERVTLFGRPEATRSEGSDAPPAYRSFSSQSSSSARLAVATHMAVSAAP